MLSSLRAEYGITPADLLDGSVSPHELRRLIEWLPDDSALAASVAGGPHMRGWTADRYMFRSMVHAVQQAISKKKVKPFPLPRPYRRGARVVSSLAGMPGAVRRSETEEG